MNWEKLTAPAFEEAIAECGKTCLLPIGVIEKHGDHLPLGQDSYTVHSVCTRAAEEERAMVFPPYYFGRINEARHQPGTVALRSDLLLPVLESVCDEIGRNGFKKILIVNGHGGNGNFLPFFLETLLDRGKDYMVMLVDLPRYPKAEGVFHAAADGHGGELETSTSLYLRPELVRTDTAADYGLSCDRLRAYADARINTSIWWYASHPGHLAADQTPGSAEKGEAEIAHEVSYLVDTIRLIKNDNTPSTLYQEYLLRSQTPSILNGE